MNSHIFAPHQQYTPPFHQPTHYKWIILATTTLLLFLTACANNPPVTPAPTPAPITTAMLPTPNASLPPTPT
ncbi:MAG TPA: hypothetical protein VLL52_01850, partial [Anaerolineae bacterium]|nr:hypothetical protein [Anaerolineae bacterium]